MASNYTENYGLCRWEATDQVLHTDFNEDNSKIEAALVKHDTAMAENAQAIQTEASARASGDLAEEQARTSAVASLMTELSKRGNCSIELKSYTGDGTYGSGHATAISFSGTPQFVVVVNKSSGGLTTLVKGCARGQVIEDNVRSLSVSWSGNTVSLTANDMYTQMNEPGKTYLAIALVGLN